MEPGRILRHQLIVNGEGEQATDVHILCSICRNIVSSRQVKQVKINYHAFSDMGLAPARAGLRINDMPEDN